MNLSKSDIDKIKGLSKNKDIFKMLRESIAPEIWGFDKIKETIILQLFGNINTLLVGDLGTAKSSFAEVVSGISTGNILCIKRLQRLSDQDKKQLMEKMEKPKALSVFATANPNLGRFDPYVPIPEQISIPTELLSMFNIVFFVRDVPNKSSDEKIASHILEGTQSKPKGAIDKELIRKYTFYAKNNINPLLSEDAKRELKKFYVGIRNPPRKKDSEIVPVAITARQLGVLVDISKAYARVRLSNEVNKQDAERAVDLMRCSLVMAGYDELIENEKK
jgi:replicative DNA helicase Mcm